MKSNSTSFLHSRWPLILAGLTALAGLGISLHLRSRIAQTEAAAAQLTAESLRLDTRQEMTLFIEVLESVRALHTLSDAVDQAAMNEFIEKGLIHQHAVLGAFGLAQRISPKIRSVLEKQAETQPGTGGYRVLQQGQDGAWIPAKSQPAYYPLTWQNRTAALNIPVGFDFSSRSDALRTIKQIERTRRTTLVPMAVPQRTEERGQSSEVGAQRTALATRQSAISNSPSPHSSLPHSTTPTHPSPPSYWVFAPVVPSSSRYAPETVIGFAVAKLNPDSILKRVAARSARSPELRLNLTAPSTSSVEETLQRVNGAWVYRHPLEAIDSQWMFECSLPIETTGHRSGIALAAGLLITALMTSQLLILGGRAQKIEAEVNARTEDLRIANLRLEKNLHERVQLEEEMNELAAHERRRIGHDLHDSLGQKLTGAVFLSRSLVDYFSSQRTEDGNQQTHAKTLNETLKSAVAQVRNMARGLAPVALNDESLSEALKQLAEEMTELYNVSCNVTECAALPSLDRKTKEQLYLIVREAVNNAARHAKAERITVQLTGGEAGWEMSVEDDGKGLPKTQSDLCSSAYLYSESGHSCAPGMGIRIMRHRAGLISAEFAITSTRDHGTCVTVKAI